MRDYSLWLGTIGGLSLFLLGLRFNILAVLEYASYSISKKLIYGMGLLSFWTLLGLLTAQAGLLAKDNTFWSGVAQLILGAVVPTAAYAYLVKFRRFRDTNALKEEDWGLTLLLGGILAMITVMMRL
jgi:hypothetical protein